MSTENNTQECRDLLLKITNTENKVDRKRAILKLRERLQGFSTVKDRDVLCKEIEEEALPTLYRSDKSFHHLMLNLEVRVIDNRCLDDSVEMCRETAALLLANYYAEAAKLHHVIPIVRKRLIETGEPSEEVRLAFLNLIAATAGSDKNKEDLKLSIDDIREIAIAAVQVCNGPMAMSRFLR